MSMRRVLPLLLGALLLASCETPRRPPAVVDSTPAIDSMVDTVSADYFEIPDDPNALDHRSGAIQPGSRLSAPTGLPPGFSLVGLQDCTQRKPTGWTDRGDAALSIFIDPVRGAVCRATYRVGFGGGAGPVNIGHDFPRSREVFTSVFLRLSPNWEGHGSGTNKFLHLWVCGAASGKCGNKIFLSAHGSGASPLRANVELQGVVPIPGPKGKLTGSYDLKGSQFVSRGQWVRWDVRIVGNTAGNADGIVEWSINGVSAGMHNNIAFTTGAATIKRIEWAPTWGGVGGRTVALMQMDIDDWLIGVH